LRGGWLNDISITVSSLKTPTSAVTVTLRRVN